MGGEALGVARRIARQIDRECVSEARLGVERLKHRTLRQIDSSNARHRCSTRTEWKPKRWCIPIARAGLSIKRSKELLLLAHREILRCRTNLVAIGAKRT